MGDTRADLLEATRRCVARRGLAATTSRAITTEAGANLAAITYHFGSKDQLVAEALLAEVRAWLSPALDVLHGDAEPARRTILAIGALVSSFEAHRASAPGVVQAMAQAPVLPALRDGFVALWTDLRRLLADDMRASQADGLLPPWVQPDAMAALLVAVANGIVLQVVVDPDGPELAALAGQFGALLLSARMTGSS